MATGPLTLSAAAAPDFSTHGFASRAAGFRVAGLRASWRMPLRGVGRAFGFGLEGEFKSLKRPGRSSISSVTNASKHVAADVWTRSPAPSAAWPTSERVMGSGPNGLRVRVLRSQGVGSIQPC